MKPILTPEQMYALERRHFSAGIPSLQIMENAAAALVSVLARQCGSFKQKSVCIACGSGNNAGDGYAIAHLLSESGAHVSLLPAVDPELLRGDASISAKRCIREDKLPLASLSALHELPRPDIWVDALFGIGLNRPMSDFYAPLVQRMERDRQAGSLVCAVDIPSGVNAESGRAEGLAVQASLTVTFEYAKTGHFLLDGLDLCGDLHVESIGLTRFLPENTALLVESHDPALAYPPRKHNSHKGNYGHVLIIAGSMGMAGAAAYAANAALRGGAGLVSIACPRSVTPILQTIVPAAMCLPLSEQDGAFSAQAAEELKEFLPGKSALVVGPGLSRRADVGIVRTALQSGLPAVVDADALNAIAAHAELRALIKPCHVLTPHPGEAARLCPTSGHPLKDAALLRQLGGVVLLKGASTVIHGHKVHISASGSPGMATGGSGDVLSGLLGAMLASGLEAETAAWCASELHGRCGEIAEAHLPAACMTASDLIESLPQAIREL